MAVNDYNVDPDLNTTISGINIAEGCPPSGINDAIRQLMADVKEAAETQSAKYVEQDAAIVAAQSSADAAQSSADAAQSSANAAQSSADAKVSKSGDRIEYLDLPIGALRSVNDDWKSLDIEGSSPDVAGALIAMRRNDSAGDPGSIALLSRNDDGSFGRFFTVLREYILTNGRINFQPTGSIVPNQTADLREFLVVAEDEAGWGGLLALRSRTDPAMPGGFLLQANGPGGTYNLAGDSSGNLAWHNHILAREHNLYVNLGGYVYGSGGVWFSGLDGQTIGVNTALSNCNCDCSDGCGSY